MGRMKTAVVLGTRPEIIKMAPVVKELQKRRADFFILHTGQHYSYSLDQVFFEQLKLPAPHYNLESGSGSHAAETAKMLVGIEGVLLEERPGIVLVEGDTNSVLAGALTAAKLDIRVGHVEAGLRSYDRRMPEEINRVLTDHLSDLLFAPTPGAREILLGEGIEDRKIFVTGNTIVDAIFQNLALVEVRGDVLASLKLRQKGYFLVTLHRQENVDDDARFTSILRGLEGLSSELGLPVLYPVHPRAKKRMAELNLEPHLTLIEPVDYFSFLQLESGARLILTDSGGVQEEACIMGVPCVTLRDNTERPETVAVGANVLAGAAPEKILGCARQMLATERHWQNPFGDGHAGARIVAAVLGA
jgi:UDP-N-acetylglucosamine 2-epimerase (non-hydrolysing)